MCSEAVQKFSSSVNMIANKSGIALRTSLESPLKTAGAKPIKNKIEIPAGSITKRGTSGSNRVNRSYRFAITPSEEKRVTKYLISGVKMYIANRSQRLHQQKVDTAAITDPLFGRQPQVGSNKH